MRIPGTASVGDGRREDKVDVDSKGKTVEEFWSCNEEGRAREFYYEWNG